MREFVPIFWKKKGYITMRCDLLFAWTNLFLFLLQYFLITLKPQNCRCSTISMSVPCYSRKELRYLGEHINNLWKEKMAGELGSLVLHGLLPCRVKYRFGKKTKTLREKIKTNRKEQVNLKVYLFFLTGKKKTVTSSSLMRGEEVRLYN